MADGTTIELATQFGMSVQNMHDTIDTLLQAIGSARQAIASGGDDGVEIETLHGLTYRANKLRRAWGRPQCLGFFGPSQAGKSFLVGAMLSHELGTLKVLARSGEVDFLEEINPAKGVESTGVVTRFTAGASPAALSKGDFHCSVLSLEVVLESLATGFLVECTSPAVDPERVERVLRDARLQAGAEAHPRYREAWDAVWHNLLKKYQSRHAYLNELKSQGQLRREDWKDGIKTSAGWMMVYTLLWGGAGYAKDLDDLMRKLLAGLDQINHAEAVEVQLAHVKASSEGTSLIDAACLNSLGRSRKVVMVFDHATGAEVAIEPGVLAALIAEIRLPLKPVAGSLLEGTDMLDFPGGRALKGINGFGPDELNAGDLDNAIEVYKRGKLTFLFEQFSLDREITALVLCSPGPTKPEAIQLQSQVERWLQIRHGVSTPTDPEEVAKPSLFMALTKFDMSLGALRSDNAMDRWDSRVGEACVEFWARNSQSWVNNWGGKDQAFSNMYWVCNPYADQMRTLRVGDDDYAAVKQGFFKSHAVQRYIADPQAKWAAMEGQDDGGLPRSGIPLLTGALRDKMAEDIKSRELVAEVTAVQRELVAVLRDLTPSRDEAEAHQRLMDNAASLIGGVKREMSRQYSGAVFGELINTLVAPVADVEAEVRQSHRVVAPMSIKTSDKVKKVLVHVLKWWVTTSMERFRESALDLPTANVERFVREVCTSKPIMSVLGKAVFRYFSRKEVNYGLVASILQVKVCDTMLSLFHTRPRRTPELPVRLSFSEDIGGVGVEDADEVDWGDVDWADASGEAPVSSVEIVFAGNRYFEAWSNGLGAFYVKTSGAKAKASLNDPRIQQLLALLKTVESLPLVADV